ncbi:SDR family oxidoreductase [Yersinia ruckeri]|uniref:SDR family oxidoreductase n=1 Tax=Yersinia ruckeri TaxID=29486 RepID=UPI001F27C601|nr:SDR family oxidoreductase [Yersinia ruckeri]UIM98404.1 SDR family oxidoreductase [Yersinia ruckeri]
MKLNNSRILLTGASGGIGQVLAHALAKRGACLILHGRNEMALTQLLHALPHPEKHQIWIADLCDTAALAKQVEVFREQSGIDILINNAGTNHFAWLESQSEQQIIQQLSLNIQAPILLTRALLPYINKPGMIMNIGSSFGSIGYAGYSVYCASKFALRGFSEALARELSGSAIHILYFAPRTTQTTLNSTAVYAMNAELGTKSDSAEWVAKQAVIALEKDVTRRWLGWPERFFVKLNALFPGVVDKALAKKHAIIARYADASSNKKDSQ